jgi:hypothetical protein
MSGRYATEQSFFESRQLKAQHDASSDHTERAIIDVRMEKAMNPKGLPIRIMSALITEDRCPNCLGNLDTGYECNDCGFDAEPWLKNSIAINDAKFNNREA